MAFVEKEKRSNTKRYINEMASRTQNEKVKNALYNIIVQMEQRGINASYNKENLARISRISGGVAVVMALRSKRYDDLFEDFMTYFSEKNINRPTNAQELSEAMDELLTGERKKSKQGLLKAFLKTRTAEDSFMEERDEEIIQREKTEYYRRQIPEKKKKTYDELVKKKLVYRIFNQKIKKNDIIYKSTGKKRTAWRSFITGRYAKNPERKTR